MTTELSNFAARLRETILSKGRVRGGPGSKRQIQNGDSCNSPLRDFNQLALELFALQFKHNAAYRRICETRGLTPQVIEQWTQIPAVPTAAFKELELTCLAPDERTAVFHSSGTTEQKPSRHFHNAESLAIYEASLWPWFGSHVLRSADSLSASSEIRGQAVRAPLVILSPPLALVPHSSLVHMFEIIRQELDAPGTAFVGKLAADGSWTLDFDEIVEALSSGGNGASSPPQTPDAKPYLLLGTAFSFLHLLDYLAENNLRFQLPTGSRVMETGGYKNRSRSLPKDELHQLITERLGVPLSHIVCEYGMSELSSQAYDTELERRSPTRRDAVGVQALACHPNKLKLELQRAGSETGAPPVTRHFRFPPWARVQIISPETGLQVVDGETGLIRVCDLANVFSVMAIQTEDLGIRRGKLFELVGRAQLAEPRGCSLMAHSTFRTPHSALA